MDASVARHAGFSSCAVQSEEAGRIVLYVMAGPAPGEGRTVPTLVTLSQREARALASQLIAWADFDGRRQGASASRAAVGLAWMSAALKIAGAMAAIAALVALALLAGSVVERLSTALGYPTG